MHKSLFIGIFSQVGSFCSHNFEYCHNFMLAFRSDKIFTFLRATQTSFCDINLKLSTSRSPLQREIDPQLKESKPNFPLSNLGKGCSKLNQFTLLAVLA